MGFLQKVGNFSYESTLKSPNMSRTKAQPLPSLVGEGQGWGQYLIRYQDITDPTPPKEIGRAHV